MKSREEIIQKYLEKNNGKVDVTIQFGRSRPYPLHSQIPSEWEIDPPKNGITEEEQKKEYEDNFNNLIKQVENKCSR